LRKTVDVVQKRDVIYGAKKLSDSVKVKMALGFLGNGQVYDAIELFDSIAEKSQLGKIKEQAISEGDAFLLSKISTCKNLEQASAEDWQSCKQKALEQKKYRYALKALVELGEDEAAEAFKIEHSIDEENFHIDDHEHDEDEDEGDEDEEA